MRPALKSRIVPCLPLLLALLQLMPGSAAFASAGQYTSPQFGYEISWDASWTKESEASVPDYYDELFLTQGTQFLVYQGYFTDLSPDAMFKWLIEGWRETVPDIRVVQPYQEPPSRIPAIVTFTDESGLLIEEIVTILQLVAGESMLFVFHGRPASETPEPVDGVALYTSPALGNAGGFSVAGVGQGTCELVELYPGYPGYRANLPGMVGPGDTACLNDLQALDPNFSRNREDQLNLEAARRLGVTSGFKDWTWETWLAIEAERGFLPVCYSCIFTNNGAPLPSLPPGTDLNDPRIRIGRYGERSVALRFFHERGFDLSLAHDAPTDNQLRALLGISNPGRYLTASEVATLQEEFLKQWYGVDGPSMSGYLNPGVLLDSLFHQGGYWPTPSSATEADQYFMIAEGVLAVGIGMSDDLTRQLMAEVDQAFLLWRVEGGSTRPSFGQWLRDAGVG
ncbi:MAG: hypothetical protein ACRDJH_05100 [Thermomicrobiales bacterium]